MSEEFCFVGLLGSVFDLCY